MQSWTGLEVRLVSDSSCVTPDRLDFGKFSFLFYKMYVIVLKSQVILRIKWDHPCELLNVFSAVYSIY